LPAYVYSQPKPARIFSNNMVLQRNAEIPIWGKASPNEQIQMDDLKGGNWEQADSASVAPFSSTAWFFAKQLHKELDVPIGIINSSWGGTPIKSWMSRESVVIFEDSIYIPELPENFNQKAWIETVKKAIENHSIRRNQISYPTKNIENELITIDYDDSAWHKTDLADESIHFGNIVWLRKKIILPEIEAEEKLIVSLGFMNRQSHIYFNGHKIGYFQYPEPVEFNIPPSLVKEGENMICIRLAHPGKQTTVYGNQKQFYISSSGNKFHIQLSQGWLFNDNLNTIIQKTPGYQNKTSFLFNGMVAPVMPFGIKGFLWYQGEADAGRPLLYKQMFQSLILDWRQKWGDNELPFLYFQLSKTKFTHFQKEPDKWEQIRKSQKKALKLQKTYMAKTKDMGDPNDIHPHNKQDFGLRMANLALKKVYKKQK
jgi:sialate O-acetylesterase